MMGFKKNIELGPPLRLSAWRKIALGTWRTTADPSVYGVLEFDIEPALNYLEKLREKTEVRLTLTHFVGKAVAMAIARYPSINCVLRWGKLYPRKRVDLFFQVASDAEGRDLSGTTLREVDRKSIIEIAQEMSGRVDSIRTAGDPEFKRVKNTMRWIPGLFMHAVLSLTSFFLYTLNRWSPLLGSPRDAFGSAMITNVGSLGLDLGFAPLLAYSRVPLLIAVGSARETPVVRQGKIEVGRMLKLGITFDHRLMDGVYAGKMAKELERIFKDPERGLQ